MPQLTRSLPVDSCALCGADHAESAPFNRCQEGGVDWRYHICGHCGLVYQAPQMNDAEISRYYAARYWPIQGQVDAPDAEQTELQQQRAEHLLSLLPSGIAVARALDIGSAGGLMLRAARDKWGAEAVGVEPGDRFRTHCQGLGFKVFDSLEGAALDVQLQDERRFDLITMSHVLEHFRDPLDPLRLIRGVLLREEGTLLVEVPNLYAHRCFEPAHPICFNATTLRAALGRAGFETTALLLHNHPHRQIDRPLYLSAVARPAIPGPEVDFEPPNVWFERVKRAYVSKRGPWWRQTLKALRVGFASLFSSDLSY